MAMTERTFETPCGAIHYWMNELRTDSPVLVFLPGLSVDHTFFKKQLERFEPNYTCLVWDAPAHGLSRPFSLDFTMDDKAKWLHGILEAEHIDRPVLIGQSMGGYVSQMYLQLYPGSAAGFFSIDSCSLKRKYVSALDIWLLKRTEPMYRAFPWKLLLKLGAEGTTMSPYGRDLVRRIWSAYSRDEYCRLVGHGYLILANALESDRPFNIDCPVQLVCGTKDQAGETKAFNKAWTKGENLPIVWIEGAGHNSNLDAPDEVNDLIERFVSGLA